jgi:hypothetical protein
MRQLTLSGGMGRRSRAKRRPILINAGTIRRFPALIRATVLIPIWSAYGPTLYS